MIVPVTRNPDIGDGIDDQTIISLTLFNIILEIANTRDELHRSWGVIFEDIGV